ncbi:MAG: PTS transporter subunit EIIC [Erysipelotrichaceae bacterium]|nr:PTS transporter subunit EIIC [Erysipelotrichaceae bacterium]
MANYENLITEIVEAVGGPENITNAWHCVTRLRFELKDWGLLKGDKLDRIKGVLGKSIAGSQLQVIIGPTVADVYDQLCDKYHLTRQEAVDENLDAGGKLTVRAAINNAISALAESFIPIIPAVVASSFVSLIPTVLGPTMLKVLSAESDLYRLFTFVGNVGFYFLPVFMGWSAAKRFGASQILGIFIGAMLLHPTLIEITNSGVPFTVYGIPMYAASYASSTIPALLSVWAMSYIEKFFKKYIPHALHMVFVPLCTVLVMLPIALCLFGPLGTILGDKLAGFVLWVAGLGWLPRVLIGTIVGGVFIFAIMFGMHIPLFMIAIGVYTANGGSEGIIMPGMMLSVFALLGMEIGAFFKAKDAENKALCASYIVTHAVGGITEPAIFGIGVRYKTPLLMSCIGAACGAFFCQIFNVLEYTIVASSNLVAVTAFAGGPTKNFILGIIAIVISIVVAAVMTYLFGFKNEKDF